MAHRIRRIADSRDRTISRLLVAGALAILAGLASAEATRYPVPRGAMGVGHFQLADTGGEEDFFYARLPYPSVQVVNHYRKVFGSWIECRPRSAWRSFHDRKEGHPTFVHQLEWHWIRADDAAVLTLTIRYPSAGDDVRDKPASDIQHVTLVEYPTPEARAVAESMGANSEPMAR